MRRRWESLLAPNPSELARERWEPPVDIYRGPSQWLVKVDLAGVRPEDVEIRVQGCRLTIRGIRRDFSVREGHKAYSMEIAYSRFERTIELPCDLDKFQIRTDYRDGMYLLEIRAQGDK